jgi:uncharacterized membrane protein
MMNADRNPEHWKLFFLYFNPDDPRLFVPKRTGLGYTINMARPIAWGVASLFAIVALASAIASDHLRR